MVPTDMVMYFPSIKEITANNLKQKRFLHLNISCLRVIIEMPRDFSHIFGSIEKVQ